jgi:peptidoglycan/LPS O-acetylase OafA/YrhL
MTPPTSTLPVASHEAKPGRDIALDVLRAAAVFLVLGRHLQDIPPGGPGWLLGPIALWRQAGWCGVDLFFVLSGFLIAGLLFKEQRQHGVISLRRFYVRRGLKIYPPFYAMIVATLVGVWIAGEAGASSPGAASPVTRSHLLAEVFFMQSYFRGMWTHTWSLAVEEHFYILLPLLLMTMGKQARRRSDPFRAVVPVFLITTVAALALRIINAGARPYHHLTHLFPTHLRIDSLMTGVALAYFHHYHRTAFIALLLPWRRWLIASGVAMFIPTLLMPLETLFIHTWGFSLCALGSAAILAGFVLAPMAPSPSTRALAYIGSHSYSIYLWHVPVMVVLEAVFKDHPSFLGESGIYLAASVVVGIVMARVIEVPVLAARDRWFPSRTAKSA